MCVVLEIVGKLWKVFVIDVSNNFFVEFCFCVVFDINYGWEIEFEIEDYKICNLIIILVDYVYLFIWCKFCFDV